VLLKQTHLQAHTQHGSSCLRGALLVCMHECMHACSTLENSHFSDTLLSHGVDD
jgi:hypothetical protein